MTQINLKQNYKIDEIINQGILKDPSILGDLEKTFFLESNKKFVIPGFFIDYLQQRETNPDYDTHIDPFLIMDLMPNVNQDDLYTGIEVVVEEINNEDFILCSDLPILNDLYKPSPQQIIQKQLEKAQQDKYLPVRQIFKELRKQEIYSKISIIDILKAMESNKVKVLEDDLGDLIQLKSIDDYFKQFILAKRVYPPRDVGDISFDDNNYYINNEHIKGRIDSKQGKLLRFLVHFIGERIYQEVVDSITETENYLNQIQPLEDQITYSDYFKLQVAQDNSFVMLRRKL